VTDSGGDYHGNFDWQNYRKWFTEQLLPSLKKGGNYVILLDNASYHSKKTPTGWEWPEGRDLWSAKKARIFSANP
jgi:hypothetical protein